nr:MAG TPA: hypothetical protein [Crassvirales sp.]
MKYCLMATRAREFPRFVISSFYNQFIHLFN